MEYIKFLVVVVTGIFGANAANNHHHHLNLPPVGACFGSHCDNHHHNCEVSHDKTGAFVGKCIDDNHCVSLCTDPHPASPCCCPDQACVDAVRNGNVVLTAHTGSVSCPNCHNFHDCDMQLHQCHPDQFCLIQTHGQNGKSKCANAHECDHAKAEATKHPDQTAVCCADDNCTLAEIQPYTSGMPHTLLCKTCHDLLTNQCEGDHMCHHEEVCMINHIEQRVETRCQKKPECEHRLHDIAHDPNAMTVCCETSHCAHFAFQSAQFIYIGTISSAPGASTAATSSNSMVSSSVAPVVSGGCSDIEDSTFLCANYIRDFDICNQVTGTGATLASTRCKMSCGLCSVTSTTPTCTDNEDSSFQCANYIRDFDICHQTSGVGFTLATTRCQKSCGLCSASSLLLTQPSTQILQSTTSTQAPTINLAAVAGTATQAQPGVTPTANLTTTAAGTNPPCVDHDVKNSCTAYSFYFCGATSGAARDFAVANCAKSCNLCNEYFAFLKNSQPVPVVG